MAKKASAELAFEVGQSVVYPAHGVGKITSVEKQTVAGMDLEVYVVSFDQDKMILRVPTNRTEASGMRALAGSKLVEAALKTLGGRARIKRTMWSRRAQEYEAKINSGDLISIAEVVRDLWRREQDRGLSAGEKRMLAKARQILVSELALAEKTDEIKAEEILDEVLAS